MNWAVVLLVVSALALIIAAYFYAWVKKLPSAGGKLDSVGQLIRKGAFAFLRREYRILGVFAGVVSIVILLFFPQPVWQGEILENVKMVLAYLFGSLLSGLSGYVGISIATIANVKAASAARNGLAPSFMAGFRGGAVMGMAVVSASLAGAAILYLLTNDSNTVLAFSFGASSLALFAKAGGGIFTKTADIAADLTGKVELGIPEDDPRNPAVIADNVGDNVGDVAGMGADLFDSNVASMAAAMVIAIPLGQVDLLFCYGALGLLASILGVLCARVGKKGNPSAALNGGTYLTCGIFAVLTLAATLLSGFEIRLWGAAIIGMVAGVVIGVTSDFFTGDERKPVEKVAQACQSGPAFTILSGISYGLISSFPSLAGIGLAALGAFKICEPLGGSYPMLGISVAAIGMLAIVGMIISNDA